MLEKDTDTTDKYKISPAVSVVVKNKKIQPEGEEAYFRTTVTLKHKSRQDRPLVFSDFDEIDKFINDIPIESNQTDLFEQDVDHSGEGNAA
jgi:hypothetical protein